MKIQIRKHRAGLDVIYSIENWDDYLDLLRERDLPQPVRRYRILVDEDARFYGHADTDEGIAELFWLTLNDVEFTSGQ